MKYTSKDGKRERDKDTQQIRDDEKQDGRDMMRVGEIQ